MLLPIFEILEGLALVKLIPDPPDIESEKSEVVKVLVATPLKISVKTSSSKVILTTEFF